MRGGLALFAAGLVSLSIGISSGFGSWQTGAYPGDTSQGANMALDVKKKKVNVVFFETIAPPCAGQYAGLEAKIKKSGKFKALSPGDGFYGYVKGKIKGKKAEGTALYHWDAMGCDSGVVTWTAEKDARR